MQKTILPISFLLTLFLFSCTPTIEPEEPELAALPTLIPSVVPPDTATAIPLPTHIPTSTPTSTDTPEPTATATPLPTATTEVIPPTETAVPLPLTTTYAAAFSVNGEPLQVHQFGRGEVHLILIGGIHGGYEWNTVLLMYELIDWLNDNLDAVPENLKLSIIPVMNPDGLKLITGSSSRFTINDVPFNTDAGRFNANGVDLNRNWDCDWNPTAYWRNEEVSGGSFVGSEKEVQNISYFIRESNPAGVVFYHSAAGALYGGRCNGAIADGTDALVRAYEVGSGFSPPERGGLNISYVATGTAIDYLATQNIAAFEVELTNHQDTEFERNLAGVLSLIDLLSE